MKQESEILEKLWQLGFVSVTNHEVRCLLEEERPETLSCLISWCDLMQRKFLTGHVQIRLKDEIAVNMEPRHIADMSCNSHLDLREQWWNQVVGNTIVSESSTR